MRTERPYLIRERADADTWHLVEDVIYAALLSISCTAPIQGMKKHAAKYAHAIAAGIEYRADNGDQTIMMPHRLLTHGRGDCKSTAVLCATIGAAAGCRVDLAFIQYDEGPTHWQHVFAIIDGIACDPLLPLGDAFPYLRGIQTRIA